MVKVETNVNERITQGDIFKNIEYIEFARENNGEIEISKIIFPYVVVLTQDCDLEQDFGVRTSSKIQDKLLMSILVAPLYNAEHVYNGEHLSQLQREMQKISKKKSTGDSLRNNETPRYHYLDFPSEIEIVPSVIDFKHYFTINLEALLEIKEKKFVCRMAPLFRERLSQRFSNFLARIGLPNV